MNPKTIKNCLMLYPEFTLPSFWNYRSTCEFAGAKYPAAPLGLITVAAMLPKEWNYRLVDMNVGELKEEDLDWADIVFSGGMIAQQSEHLKLIEMTQAKGLIHVVGGPDATSNPAVYHQATHQVLGEAEVSLPEFLADFFDGNARKRYEAGARKADVTKTPVPMFELLNFDNYLHVGVQFGRGCPFNCEFCDIIELFGRVPRLKDNDQILLELDRLYELGYRGHVDMVDDNFIGNRGAVKKFLPELKKWLVAHKHPFEFTTEATINLADDKELMTLMEETGFFAIFVGIESPDEETLKQTQKNQNTKRSIPDSVKRIYKHGMVVNAGYIIGFDNEKGSVAQGMIQSIADTSIPVNMIGMLFALPNTQLARRLSKEGRLFEDFDKQPETGGDQCLGGLNFDTSRPKLDILTDYRKVIDVVYSPSEYFKRVRFVGENLGCKKKKLTLPLRYQIKDLKSFYRFVTRMGFRKGWAKEVWKTLGWTLIKNPRAIRYVVGMMALYHHVGTFKDLLLSQLSEEIEREKRTASIPKPKVVRRQVNADTAKETVSLGSQ